MPGPAGLVPCVVGAVSPEHPVLAKSAQPRRMVVPVCQLSIVFMAVLPSSAHAVADPDDRRPRRSSIGEYVKNAEPPESIERRTRCPSDSPGRRWLRGEMPARDPARKSPCPVPPLAPKVDTERDSGKPTCGVGTFSVHLFMEQV